MMKTKMLFLVVGLLLFCTKISFAHCEIPCGIYDDEQWIDMMDEHITTIEKSIKMIEALSQEEAKNYNQIVRWVMNKEKHAEKLQEIISRYFLTQRIKPVDPKKKRAYKKYVKELTLLHQMIVYAMKTKQSTDLKNVEILRDLTKEFRSSYFEKPRKKGR